jgi:hypothetical protein
MSLPCHTNVARASEYVDMRRLTLLALLVLVVSCGASGGGATTSPASPSASMLANPENQGDEITVALTGPPLVPGTPACASGCPLPYTQTGTTTGSFRGRITGAGAVVLDHGRFAGATTFVFRGAIDSCGVGTLVLRRWEEGTLGTTDLTGTWEIASGFGTGQLAEVSGSGTIAAGAARAGVEISSTLHGHVACRDDVAPIHPSPKPLHGGRRVRAEATTAPPSLGTPACDTEGACVYPSTQQTHYAGSIDGTGHAAGAGYTTALPGGRFAYAATALSIITGAIDKCGTGTVVSRSRSEFDGEQLTTTWELVQGFGTGALASARGRGTARGVREADGSYEATFTGKISCK